MPTLADLSWPRSTARLSFRPATPTDAEPTWRYRRLPEVNRWLTSAPPTLEAYAERFRIPENLAKTLVLEKDGEVVGDLYLAVQDAWAQTEVAEQAKGVQAEIGWALAPEHTGHGFATEAVTELVRLCFEDLGLRRLVAYCFADNEASWRLMKRIGMRREAHVVGESLHRSGAWLDGLGYGLLAQEWRHRR